jgi:hypothetical protein
MVLMQVAKAEYPLSIRSTAGYRFFEHALIGTSTFSSYSVNAAFEYDAWGR